MREIPQVLPWDDYNKQLAANTHPDDWINPKPLDRYNLVVIGAGTAGLVTAAGAAGLGAKVALIERNFLGGDCLNVGCVPSKAIIRSSRVVAEMRDAARFGIRASANVEADFAAVMERMRKIRSHISQHDSVTRFTSLGVDMFLGDAHFNGPDTVEVDGSILRFKKAVIATGARADQPHPEIEGLGEVEYLTNETVFSLTERPRRFAVIGAGPIGCELAQTFQRLGCEVVLFHSGAHILNREDADAAEIVQQTLTREGICLVLQSTIKRVESGSDGKVLHFEAGGRADSVTVDAILVGAGRTPNVDGLNLEKVNVQYDQRRGVVVNDYLQTTNPRIYAGGDICMDWKFTHAADAAARIIIQNALFYNSKKLSSLTMPWTTYTDPEIAHVGMYDRDAERQGIAIDTYTRQLNEVDRAIADGEEEGFVKVHVKKGTDKIVGATIVARHAGEMISELTLAMVGNIGLGTIGNVIHPYPTQAEAIKQTGDAFNRTRLTPLVKNLFKRWLSWNC